MTAPIDVLYLLGPGHCGSTLLNLALDRHPEVLGLGEIVALNRAKPGFAGEENILSSLFWQAVAADYEAAGAGRFDAVPFHCRADALSDPARAKAWATANRSALASTAAVSRKPIMADSSKDARRLQALLRVPGLRVRVIYLVRDGRAVVHAYSRKYHRWSLGYRKMMRIDRDAERLRARHPECGWLTLRYEDLATDMEGVLRQTCAFAGIAFDPAMLALDTASYRGIGGNRMRRRPVEAIVLDEAWKSEMPRLQRVFTAIAVRSFNRRHGYVQAWWSRLPQIG